MIHVLDKATIDKIAAGEVIERPSSVVKELLENSIDAKATSITVEIKDGGMSFIRVTDNGCGIPKDEIRTAYMRHATSKIESAEDLAKIESLGFRGEALSTIAAVSQTEMITKTADALTGMKYVIHGGTEIECLEVGVPNGTTIVCRNLFFNTPARKKFLKSAMTEGSYIADLLMHIAMSHPEISFKLIVNSQTKIDTSGNGNIKDTIYQLFGRDITSNVIEVHAEENDIKIDGYIGKPFISRGNRGLENYFINNRYIKSNIVNRAIEEGYKTFVMQHKFPFTVLYITLPADKCDVNVHPTKMEFKYDNERQLFETVMHTIQNALTHKEIIPKETADTVAEKRAEQKKQNEQKASIKPVEPYEANRAATIRKPIPNSQASKYSPTYKILESLRKAEQEATTVRPIDTITKPEEPHKEEPHKEEPHKEEPNFALQLLKDSDVKYEPSKQENKQTSMFDDDFLTEKARKKHTIIGQLFETYWLIQYERNLYIMDQHAAHEKVNYERLMKNFKKREIFSQQLMPPMVITVSYAEKQAVLDHYDMFMKLGFDITEFGGNEFKINAVPANIYGLHGREMFMSFVTSLMETNGYISNDIFIQKLATMACKASIKGNMRVTATEIDALLDELLALDNPYTCPHGRPTIISISEQELEKKFRRIVS